MTTTTTTEYGFRTTATRDQRLTKTKWPRESDGKVSPYFAAHDVGYVDASDLAAMHGAAENYNTRTHAYGTVVVSRQRITTTSDPVVVSAPPKVDAKLHGLLPGSVVSATRSIRTPECLWVLTDDDDGLPWKALSDRPTSSWAAPRELSSVRVLHAVRA